MAGVVGFEPTHGDTKNRCLTAWLHPTIGECEGERWCRNTDSNRGPDDYKSTALPTELLRHNTIFRFTDLFIAFLWAGVKSKPLRNSALQIIDLKITNQLLYQLSYCGTTQFSFSPTFS